MAIRSTEYTMLRRSRSSNLSRDVLIFTQGTRQRNREERTFSVLPNLLTKARTLAEYHWIAYQLERNILQSRHWAYVSNAHRESNRKKELEEKTAHIHLKSKSARLEQNGNGERRNEDTEEIRRNREEKGKRKASFTLQWNSRIGKGTWSARMAAEASTVGEQHIIAIPTFNSTGLIGTLRTK